MGRIGQEQPVAIRSHPQYALPHPLNALKAMVFVEFSNR
jgi:hypothetical protein